MIMKLSGTKCITLTVAVIFVLLVSPISPVHAEAASEKVRIGGYPINIELYAEGPVVSSVSGDADSGMCANVRKGDIITEINGISVSDMSDIDAILESDDLAIPVVLAVLRGGMRICCSVIPRRAHGGKLSLGMTFKEGVSGLGTVTFSRSDGSYRALGHAITDASGGRIEASYGYVYDTDIIGVKLPSGESAGRLIGRRNGSEPVGNILENDMFGIEGMFFDARDDKEFEVLSHDKVHTGKAAIYTTVGARRVKYDIEIVKTSRSSEPGEKSMVIRMTDPELLSVTGGILQGMSGSPIVQDGKLAGAVTHVFTGDPSRGYGVYAEWML